MKNKILNLGIILNQEELKQIKGGLYKLTVQNDECGIPDSLLPPGCGCTSDSQCAYFGPINTDWTVAQIQSMRGSCMLGACR